MTPAEQLGTALGHALAPPVALVTRWRRSRVFHPLGDLYAGTASPVAGRHEPLGARLAGPVLARFSGGLWKHARPWPDVLGVALRFHSGDPFLPQPGDQDLLLITSRSLHALPVALFATDTTDFLHNDYDAGPPFRSFGALVRLRLAFDRAPAAEGDRRQRLASAVAAAGVSATLLGRAPGEDEWGAVARLVLSRAVDPGARLLGFSPFRDGRGLAPAGFTHALRRHVYPAAQRVRQAIGAR